MRRSAAAVAVALLAVVGGTARFVWARTALYVSARGRVYSIVRR
jgi:hypothetical protein